MSDIAARGGPAKVSPPETPGLSGLLTLAIGVVVVAGLYFGKDVLLPIVLAVLLSFVLAPVVGLLERVLPRAVAAVLAVLLALGVIAALGTVIATQVGELAVDLPRYQATVERKVETLRSATVGRVSDLVGQLNRRMERMAPAGPAAGEGGGAAQPGGDKPMLVEIKQPATSPVAMIQSVLGPILHPLETTGLVLIVTIFLLLQQHDLRDRMIRLVGSGDLHRTTVAMDDAAGRLSKYFLTQLALNTSFGVLVAVGLWAIGIPSPILWGVLSALLRFVPCVGAVISAVPPLALAAAVDPGWSMLAWTAALYLITEPIMGNVVEPAVYGHSTGMSPFAVIVAAIFWTWLWGPAGLILSTPFTLCLVVLGRHVDRLEFLDVLLGDRPALTPVENFYQRMLAGDPDEARENAEHLLKERSLSSYYDEVALKGLQLAAGDASRGVLTPAQIETIRTSIRDLVEDLDGHEDTDPDTPPVQDGPAKSPAREADLPAKPAVAAQAADKTSDERWTAPGAVLCVAGRGALDEGASRCLAQLLRKHGFGSELVSHAAVARGAIGTLATASTRMICVSYLEISGNPAHLRYLIQRLKRRAPEARVLVGLWPTEDAILTDAALRREVGSDDYVVTLREALKACLAAAGGGASPPAA